MGEFMLRRAKAQDAQAVLELLQQIFTDMELEIIQKYPQQIHNLLEDSFSELKIYQNTIVIEKRHQVVGVLVGYPAVLEKKINSYYQKLAPKYRLPLNLELFVEESWPNEWYLDYLAVAPAYQGHGLATKLIESLPQFFEVSLVGLNVDFRNHRALRLYQRLGFQIVGTIKIGFHQYHHMQKIYISNN